MQNQNIFITIFETCAYCRWYHHQRRNHRQQDVLHPGGHRRHRDGQRRGRDVAQWWLLLRRDLPADQRETRGQRESRDLLQFVFSVGGALQRGAGPVPAHATHHGKRRGWKASHAFLNFKIMGFIRVGKFLLSKKYIKSVFFAKRHILNRGVAWVMHHVLCFISWNLTRDLFNECNCILLNVSCGLWKSISLIKPTFYSQQELLFRFDPNFFIQKIQHVLMIFLFTAHWMMYIKTSIQILELNLLEIFDLSAFDVDSWLI